MKKYKLLKDLPGLEVGQEIEIEKVILLSNPPQDRLYVYHNGRMVSPELTTIILSVIEDEEWFEEILEEVEAPQSWADLGGVNGYSIDPNRGVVPCEPSCSTQDQRYKNVFATEDQAKSALAMAQLSQLMKHPAYHGDWKPKFGSGGDAYVITFIGGQVDTGFSHDMAYFLAFKSEEIRDKFLENHRDLIEEYFLMYE